MKSLSRPLTVAWISDFPIEWLTNIPDSVQRLPREHPATWAMVLLAEFEQMPEICLHVLVLRKNIGSSFSFQRNGVTFHVLSYAGGLRASSLFWVDTLLIRRVLRRIKPDVVHAWGSERGAALAASRLRYPYLITIQGLLNWYAEILPQSFSQKFFCWIERISLSRGRHASTESNFSAAYLQKRYPALAVHQIEHAPNWMFHRVRREPATIPIRFLANGTLSHRKGTDLLLLALNELASELTFEATIIGTPNESFTASLLAELSPETRRRITFRCDVQPAEIAQELSKTTIFLLPTRADTSPNAVKEAVVAGVPVVASNVGGIPDYVLPGENGFLFTPGNQAEFVAMIQAAVRHPLFSRGCVTPASLKRNREYLSPANMAKRFLSAYNVVATKP